MPHPGLAEIKKKANSLMRSDSGHSVRVEVNSPLCIVPLFASPAFAHCLPPVMTTSAFYLNAILRALFVAAYCIPQILCVNLTIPLGDAAIFASDSGTNSRIQFSPPLNSPLNIWTLQFVPDANHFAAFAAAPEASVSLEFQGMFALYLHEL